MATIYREFTVDAPADAVWARMSALGRAHELFSFLVGSEVEGDRRVCHMADGARLEELILDVDPERRRIAYAILRSPFGMEFHSASWQAFPRGDTTLFAWTTDVKPDGMAPELAKVIDGELANIRSALEEVAA
ncbi:MAG: SRPBCC family protein [Myxococcales bacterium]|nr:SRPBCC family protein [Myxococcales bacterium]